MNLSLFYFKNGPFVYDLAFLSLCDLDYTEQSIERSVEEEPEVLLYVGCDFYL
jgi:hypothetical protein